jgi:hypothetical protein
LNRLYSSLIANAEWIDDLREADVIFVATHSQGSVVSTHLMSKLVQEGVIYPRPEELIPTGGDTFPSAVGLPRLSERKIQRVCCLALCGIHLGPLRYLRSSSVVAPYIQVHLDFKFSSIRFNPQDISISRTQPPANSLSSKTRRARSRKRM